MDQAKPFGILNKNWLRKQPTAFRLSCELFRARCYYFRLFDSIGIYQQVPEAIRLKAMQWLARLNLTHLAKKPFRSLSWGQQRLLLITRAMVKYPPVLIFR